MNFKKIKRKQNQPNHGEAHELEQAKEGGLKVLDQRMITSKYTICQDSLAYRVWHFICILACLYSSLAYPYFTMNDFPTWE